MTPSPMLEQLYDEEVGELHLPEDPQAVQLQDVRRMLVRLRQLERDQAQVQAARDAVVDSYTQRLTEIADQVAMLRGNLLSVLERGPFGTKLDFPDAGKLHLSTVAASLKLANQEAAVGTYGYRFSRAVCDVPAMNKWAKEHYTSTSQVPEGYELVPSRKTLVVKQP